MKIPMKQKYVDEAVGVYFPFGMHTNRTVDVSDGQRDVFESLPQEAAEAVCAAQSEFRHRLYQVLCGAPQ